MIQHIMQMSILAIPTAIIFFCFLPYRKKALTAMGLRSSIFREINLIIYVMIIAGIISLKLRPVYYWDRSSGVWGNIVLFVGRPSFDMLVNLVPFGSIVDIQEWLNWGTANLHDVIINLIGNLIVFIPIGFFTSALFCEETLTRTVIVGGGISILTEIAQYFLMRYASIDNVLINVFGAVCGYWLFIQIKYIFPKLIYHFRCQPKNK